MILTLIIFAAIGTQVQNLAPEVKDLDINQECTQCQEVLNEL